VAGKPSLPEQVRRCLRLKHYSIRTERAYLDWVKRLILFHHERHPSEMGADEIRQFLSHLASQRAVAAATQNQALCALLFLYRDLLQANGLSWRASSGPSGRRASPRS
jgi:hypothetical protein